MLSEGALSATFTTHKEHGSALSWFASGNRAHRAQFLYSGRARLDEFLRSVCSTFSKLSQKIAPSQAAAQFSASPVPTPSRTVRHSRLDCGMSRRCFLFSVCSRYSSSLRLTLPYQGSTLLYPKAGRGNPPHFAGNRPLPLQARCQG